MTLSRTGGPIRPTRSHDSPDQLDSLDAATDALEYDEVCDASLPLEDVLSPDLALRELLRSIDPNKARVLALTNAYKTVGSSSFSPWNPISEEDC